MRQTFGLTSEFRWSLLRVPRYHWVNGAADRIGCLNCVSAIFVPVLRDRPCLGPLFMAQWPTTSVNAWHEIRAMGARPLQWPVSVIPNEELEQFRRSLETVVCETVPNPCKAGDRIFVNFPGAQNVTGYCVWASKGIVSVKIIFLNREVLLQLPYSAVQAVIAPEGQ